MVFTLLKKLFPPARPRSSSNISLKTPPPPREYYDLWASRCQVQTVERYKRPNYNGSIWFEGTQLHVRNIPSMSFGDVSLEGIYNVAGTADVLDVLYFKQDLMGMKNNMPVLVVNRNTGGYHEVEANIEKAASDDKGGINQLRAEILRYAQKHLKVTFA